MPSLRDEITKTIRRLSGRAGQQSNDLEETRLASDFREGRQYGSYRILRRLGSGGMGHVYLAQDMRLGRHAALKFLSPTLKSNPEMMARLQQEARTASSLNHPNILTIYDIDEAEGEPFIASEFVDGITLRQLLERERVEPSAALDIAIQIASALQPAHEAGIIHRDLKPGNVMLRPDGLLKVIDFGLAKFTSRSQAADLEKEPLSDPGSIAGTVQYMSPEQARGEEVDSRTDLWSLGVMLYEMVARKKPFDGETESHLIVAILDHRPAELKLASGLPSRLAKVVERALAKSPEKRYQTALEMLSALQALEGSSHSRPSRIVASALAIRKEHPSRRFWIGAFLCTLLAGLAIWWWPLRGRETLLGPDWFAPVHYTQVTNRGDVNLASISPSGKRIAYRTTTAGQDQLHLLNLETHAQWTWPPYPGDTVGITFSPDSVTVYLTVHDKREWGRLYAARERSSDFTFVLDDVDGPVSFSPNGTEFAFRRRFDDKRTNREAVVIAKTADTGDQRTILSKYNTLVGPRIAWSPDNVLAVNLVKEDLSGDAHPTVLLFSPNGRELQQYQDPRLRRLSGPAWLDAPSLLIFSGVGRGGDESESTVVELSRPNGQFRFFTSLPLAPQSLTASADLRTIAALSSSRKSTLWVADSAHLDAPEQWSAKDSNDSFDSLTWSFDDAIVHPSPRGGNIALWRAESTGTTRLIPQPNDCMSREPALVPGKKMLVFSSNCDASANASNLWLLNQTDGSLFKLTEHSHSDEWPAVAEDGNTVIYNSWPNNFPSLMKLSLRTHAKSQFTALQSRNAAISPDGQHVACQIRENYDGQWRVAVLSMRDGAIEKDNLPLPAEVNSVTRWSPDGSALDYVNAHDPSNIWQLPLNGSPGKALTHLQGPPIGYFAWNTNGTRLAWVSSDVRRDVIIFHRGNK